jgi:flagellar hook-associated protein 2
MRKALYEKVEGVGLSLKDIGIESRSYIEKGKLYLDEDKLKGMLLNRPDEVSKLLNGVDLDNPTYSRNFTTEQKKDRYDKSGVLQRLSDIIEDNISTVRNSSDKKGVLLEKAGIENDLSNTRNLLNEEMDHYDERIYTLIDKLTKKEENYYLKFSKLESMLARMNQQSSWIANQFSSGQ